MLSPNPETEMAFKLEKNTRIDFSKLSDGRSTPEQRAADAAELLRRIQDAPFAGKTLRRLEVRATTVWSYGAPGEIMVRAETPRGPLELVFDHGREEDFEAGIAADLNSLAVRERNHPAAPLHLDVEVEGCEQMKKNHIAYSHL